MPVSPIRGPTRLPPAGSVAPKKLRTDTDELSVKLWIYNYLLNIEPQKTKEALWKLAREVPGRGKEALERSKEEWKKKIPNHGNEIYNELYPPMYVVSRDQNIRISNLTY